MSTVELWFHNKWRPAIAWLYFLTVLFDFVLAPVGFSLVQFFSASKPIIQWSPITLMGGGLFHISMLTIVGVTAYGRTREKLRHIASDLKVSDSVNPDQFNNSNQGGL